MPTAPTSHLPLPVYIEEFFLSEAVRSEDRGELQFTVDTLALRGRPGGDGGTSAGLDIEYGLTNRLQLAVELPYGFSARPLSETPRAFSTASAGVLYQFIRSNHPFALSSAVNFDIPLTSRGDFGVEPEIMAAKAFGTLQIHTSFIPEFDDDGKSFSYNVAAVRPLRHNFIPTLEYNGRDAAGVRTSYITPGLYKHLPHRLEVGAGMPIGAGAHSSRIGGVMKMTWEMGGDDDD